MIDTGLGWGLGCLQKEGHLLELGQRIRAYRGVAGMTQEELAEKMYVSRQTISNREKDKSYPNIHSLLMLDSLFDVSLDILVKGDIEMMKVSKTSWKQRCLRNKRGSPRMRN